MFWRKQKSADQQVKEDRDAIIASLGPKWKYYCEALPFKAGVPLSCRIEGFAKPTMIGILEHYPSTKHAPPQALWLMIFTAVLDSKTHSPAEVHAAVAELQEKYTGG